MKHIFIINPKAGKHNNISAFIEEIKAVFTSLKDQYEILITEYKGHASEIAENACKNNDFVRLYSFGGDGTLNEILCGAVLYKNFEIAVFPCGTGNDFVKALGYSHTNICALIYGKSSACDLIKVNDTYSINIASVGFDSEVGRNAVRFKAFGSLAYNLSLIYCFFTRMGTMLTVRIDEQKPITDKFLFVVCANGSYYGGGYHPAPHASLTDGFLNFILIKRISRLKILSLIKEYKNGTHLDPKYQGFIQSFSGKRMAITAEKEFFINKDGEIIPSKNATFEILPQGIRIVIPHEISSKMKETTDMHS